MPSTFYDMRRMARGKQLGRDKQSREGVTTDGIRLSKVSGATDSMALMGLMGPERQAPYIKHRTVNVKRRTLLAALGFSR